jgi:TetR/AcrR family transcriptional regulator, transcriptional repressor for nem operon
VSVDEILEESGTGKGQFYHYFKAKEGLIEAVIDNFDSFMKSADCPIKHDIQSWKDLETFLKYFIQATKGFDQPRACPMGMIGTGLDDDQSGLRDKINDVLDYSKSALIKFFNQAKKNGEFNQVVNSEMLADFCQSMIQGGLVLAKIRKDVRPLENTVKHVLKYLKSLRA